MEQFDRSLQDTQVLWDDSKSHLSPSLDSLLPVEEFPPLVLPLNTLSEFSSVLGGSHLPEKEQALEFLQLKRLSLKALLWFIQKDVRNFDLYVASMKSQVLPSLIDAAYQHINDIQLGDFDSDLRLVGTLERLYETTHNPTLLVPKSQQPPTQEPSAMPFTYSHSYGGTIRRTKLTQF
jgi:hypothetical protein